VVYGIIMAGGKGTRLWPEGRAGKPKQLLKLLGDQTLIEIAVGRLARLIPVERQLIITTVEYADQIAEALPDFPRENILPEPRGRNTAPCIGWGTVKVLQQDPDAVIAVVTADHAIRDEAEFIEDLRTAAEIAASRDTIVTIGLVPTRPDTGFGYICSGTEFVESNGRKAFAIREFKEKPDAATAQQYVDAGNYLWNSGMFIMRASHAMDLFAEHTPELFAQLKNIQNALGTKGEESATNDAYDSMDPQSIDVGIMEKAKNVYVIPGDFGWSDIGTWSSLEQVTEADSDGNLVSGNHVGLNTENCVVRSSGRLVATVGVSNLVIVETDDAVLVCTKEQAQRVREVVAHLESESREDVL
jgi:mannose-1-phosphate guanylyltransferase